MSFASASCKCRQEADSSEGLGRSKRPPAPRPSWWEHPHQVRVPSLASSGNRPLARVLHQLSGAPGLSLTCLRVWVLGATPLALLRTWHPFPSVHCWVPHMLPESAELSPGAAAPSEPVCWEPQPVPSLNCCLQPTTPRSTPPHPDLS